jgi:type I restriction enzyme, S subunit
MSINGTIGSLAYYNNEQVVLGKSVAYINISSKALKEFIYCYISTRNVAEYFEAELTGSTIRNLSLKSIKNTTILLPPHPEQIAIASLLSTWDYSVEKTERLIVAKEKGFTALTQNLIHSSTDGLQHFHLRDICEPVTRKNSVNELNVLTTSAQHGLISQMDYYKKSVSAEDVRGYCLLKNGEFAYNRSSSNGYPYGAIKRLEDYSQGVLSTLYLCFSLKKDAPCDSDFMAHAFEAGLLNKQLVGVCQEGARSHGLLNITKTDFFGLKISLPTITEQRQIAAILNNARQEIDLLKKQAEAFRRQKRGLMQKLLSGEWRVKTVEETR